MANCFICNRRLGIFTKKAKTADGKYICSDDADKYLKIKNSLANGYGSRFNKLTSSEIIEDINTAEQKREELLEGYRVMDLPSLAQKVPGINLKKNEYAYYAYNHNVEWLEERSRTSRINYGGLTGTIHIAKGLNYRLGSIKTDIQHENYLKLIFNGAVLLTNKRIILGNNEGVKAYPFTRLLKAIPYKDGVVLCSESGKKVILEGFDDAEPFNIILDRLLTEDNILPAK